MTTKAKATIPGMWSDMFAQLPSTSEAARVAGGLIAGRSAKRVQEPATWTTTRERTDHLGCVLEIWERANKTATSWHWKTRGVITISGTAESEERARWFAYTAARIIDAMSNQAPTTTDGGSKRSRIVTTIGGDTFHSHGRGRGGAKQRRMTQTELDLTPKRPARTGRATT